jgi:hypothetical protein
MATTYTRRHTFDATEGDASPWDTLERMAAEVGCEVEEREPGTLTMVPRRTPVGVQTRARLMLSEPIGPESRDGTTRAEYMAKMCEGAGVRFIDGREV